MMNKALVGLLAAIGLASAATAQQSRTIDPNKILFTMSTIADDAAPVAPLKGKPGAADVTFHEDDWRQIEFFPASREAELRQVLTTLAAFDKAQRGEMGWKKIYVRKLPAHLVIAGKAALATLAKSLGAPVQSGPVITRGAGDILGRVTHGFSLPVGKGVALYGLSDTTGVPVLGVTVQDGAEDNALSKAFAKLNASQHLILVDWRSQLLITGVTANGGLASWHP